MTIVLNFLIVTNAVIPILETAEVPSIVTRANATDSNVGENARLKFNFLCSDLDLINRNTGIIESQVPLYGNDILQH